MQWEIAVEAARLSRPELASAVDDAMAAKVAALAESGLKSWDKPMRKYQRAVEAAVDAVERWYSTVSEPAESIRPVIQTEVEFLNSKAQCHSFRDAGDLHAWSGSRVTGGN